MPFGLRESLVTCLRPDAGSDRCDDMVRTTAPSSADRSARSVNLVEQCAFGEMLLLHLGPAAEHVLDGDQPHLGELALELGGDRRIVHAVAELGDDALALWRI